MSVFLSSNESSASPAKRPIVLPQERYINFTVTQYFNFIAAG